MERCVSRAHGFGPWRRLGGNRCSPEFTTAAGNTGYSYANALLGNFQSYTENQFRPHTDIEMRMIQWYAQDQWRVNRRLSFNYGMRFGYHTPYYQRNDVGSSFDPFKYNASKTFLYVPYCTVAVTTAACASANQRAVDPPILIVSDALPRTFV